MPDGHSTFSEDRGFQTAGLTGAVACDLLLVGSPRGFGSCWRRLRHLRAPRFGSPSNRVIGVRRRSFDPGRRWRPIWRPTSHCWPSGLCRATGRRARSIRLRRWQGGLRRRQCRPFVAGQLRGSGPDIEAPASIIRIGEPVPVPYLGVPGVASAGVSPSKAASDSSRQTPRAPSRRQAMAAGLDDATPDCQNGLCWRAGGRK